MDWWVDLASLGIQGLLIPFLQVVCTLFFLNQFFPELSGSLRLGKLGSFLLNFVVVDYIYYWNHRLLHRPELWLIHRLHHSSKDLDLFSTSRNSWFSSFFMIYFWLNTLFAFLVDSPESYLLSVALTASLDLIRHTGFYSFWNPSHKWLSWILITPLDHAWHHSQDTQAVNFGANLNLWDRWHGTYLRNPKTAPKNFGLSESLILSDEFIKPRR